MKSKFDFNDVYEVVKLIPKGRITSYGAIAAYLGLKSGARMVGWAMNSVHEFKKVPAHRVLNRNGLLTGKMHFQTPTRMQELLEKEGLIIKNDQVQHFEKVFWDPSIELL
ncbi:MAG: cysteine methyltransferase [Chitinophagaceae bacterium]|nr:cysteine methyltransferase [Chitinophagaceae bacterium]